MKNYRKYQKEKGKSQKNWTPTIDQAIRDLILGTFF